MSWMLRKVSQVDLVGNRHGALDKKALDGNASQDLRNGARGGSIAIQVFHAVQPGSESRIECGFDRVANGVCFGGSIDDVSSALASLLAHAHVYHRQSERGRLHDAA